MNGSRDYKCCSKCGVCSVLALMNYVYMNLKHYSSTHVSSIRSGPVTMFNLRMFQSQNPNSNWKMGPLSTGTKCICICFVSPTTISFYINNWCDFSKSWHIDSTQEVNSDWPTSLFDNINNAYES